MKPLPGPHPKLPQQKCGSVEVWEFVNSFFFFNPLSAADATRSQCRQQATSTVARYLPLRRLLVSQRVQLYVAVWECGPSVGLAKSAQCAPQLPRDRLANLAYADATRSQLQQATGTVARDAAVLASFPVPVSIAGVPTSLPRTDTLLVQRLRHHAQPRHRSPGRCSASPSPNTGADIPLWVLPRATLPFRRPGGGVYTEILF